MRTWLARRCYRLARVLLRRAMPVQLEISTPHAPGVTRVRALIVMDDQSAIAGLLATTDWAAVAARTAGSRPGDLICGVVPQVGACPECGQVHGGEAAH